MPSTSPNRLRTLKLRVTDAAGTPVRQSRTTLMDASRAMAAGRTDKRGEIVFSVLGPDALLEVELAVGHYAFATLSSVRAGRPSSFHVVVAEPADAGRAAKKARPATVYARRGHDVDVRIVDDEGVPVPSAVVEGMYWHESVTDASGQARVAASVQDDGSPRITVEAFNVSRTAREASFSGGVWTVVFERPAALAATVRSRSGTALEGALATLDGALDPRPGSDDSGDRPTTVRTDALGRFRIERVDPQSDALHLTIEAAGFATAEWIGRLRNAPRVFDLQRESTVEFTLRVPGGVPPPASVRVWVPGSVLFAGERGETQEVTGSWRLIDVGPGVTRVQGLVPCEHEFRFGTREGVRARVLAALREGATTDIGEVLLGEPVPPALAPEGSPEADLPDLDWPDSQPPSMRVPSPR